MFRATSGEGETGRGEMRQGVNGAFGTGTRAAGVKANRGPRLGERTLRTKR